MKWISHINFFLSFLVNFSLQLVCRIFCINYLSSSSFQFSFNFLIVLISFLLFLFAPKRILRLRQITWKCFPSAPFRRWGVRATFLYPTKSPKVFVVPIDGLSFFKDYWQGSGLFETRVNFVLFWRLFWPLLSSFVLVSLLLLVRGGLNQFNLLLLLRLERSNLLL